MRTSIEAHGHGQTGLAGLFDGVLCYAPVPAAALPALRTNDDGELRN
jgi:hypothetical protein